MISINYRYGRNVVTAIRYTGMCFKNRYHPLIDTPAVHRRVNRRESDYVVPDPRKHIQMRETGSTQMDAGQFVRTHNSDCKRFGSEAALDNL